VKVAMEKAGIYDAVKDRLVLTENVQQAMTYAKEGSVDISFVALSLAIANDTKDYLAVELDLHEPLEQTMVVCGSGPATESARELVAYCGLEWEEGCGEFWKSSRAVSTISTMQVRQPPKRPGMRAEAYSAHLGPLIETLKVMSVNPATGRYAGNEDS
jgi:hypothetical protein